MTYEESASLMSDSAFRGRVKVSCLKFADYITNESNTIPAHNTRLRWANNTMQNPEMTAAQIQPPVVMTADVQAAGAAITDEALQVAVETTVNKMM